MAATVKISPRVAVDVARRLRLAASVRSRSMSAVVNDVLDATLPSLEEIRAQLDYYVLPAGSGSEPPGRWLPTSQAPEGGAGDGSVL